MPKTPATGPKTTEDMRRLRVWRRFHVAITALYGVPVLLLVTALIVAYHQRAVQLELGALKDRLLGISTTLSYTLDPALFEGPAAEARCAPVRAVFESIAAEEGDVASIYLARKTDKDGFVEFMCDWETPARGASATPGQIYDARQTARMIPAFASRQVEKDIYSDEWGRTLSGYAPVIDASGKSVGIVGVDVAGDRVDAIHREVLLASLALYGVTTILLFGLAQIVGRSIRNPLLRLLDATTAISSGRLDARAALDRPDEFGILGRHFDGMAAGLQEREFFKDTFGRYMSDRLAKRLLGDPLATRLGGEELDVTVLFCDLKDHPLAVEQLGAATTVALLNEYASAMNDVVDGHEGVVVELLGDAILAVFGILDDDPKHADHAIAAAAAMRARVADLDQLWTGSGLAAPWRAAGIPSVRLRIGINTGTVVAGNMGGHMRMKYAVIGDTVNVASRVEALNDELGTDVLATATTWERLSEPLRAGLIPRGQHKVKGRSHPVDVYEIAGR